MQQAEVRKYANVCVYLTKNAIETTTLLEKMHHSLVLLPMVPVHDICHFYQDSHSFTDKKKSRTFQDPHEKFCRTFSEPENV